MRKLLLSTVAMACFLPAAAMAQDQSAQGSQSSSDAANATAAGNTTSLSDIIVTAQRKSESAQRAAIAINVIGGADLVGAGVTEAPLLGSVVPALSIESVGPSTAFFVRGVGNFSVSVTSDPAVAFNYDGVYLGRHTATTTAFYDLDRVEVLKGPQGTLYGRNATAGAVNVLPTQPKLGQWGGYATLTYGNYNDRAAEGAVNMPLGDKGALRVSGVINRRDGYLSDGTSDDHSEGLRVQMKSELTPDLTVRAAFDYSHLGGKGEGLTYFESYAYNATTGQFTISPTGIPYSSGNLSAQSQAYWMSRPTRVAGRLNDPFPALYQDSGYYGGNVDIEYKTDLGTLTIVPAARFDQIKNLNPGGGFPIANDQRDVQYSIEARFAGKVSIFDYTLGFYYFNEKADLKQGTVTGGSSENFASPTDVSTQSYAPFARLTANLSDRLRLVGGVRYTHDDKQFFATTTTIAVACAVASCPTAILPPAVPYITMLPFPYPAASGGVVPAGPAGEIVSRTDISFNNTLSKGKATYRGAVEFDLRPSSLLYASVETGFRSGGFSTSVGYETYQPEYLTAYTIGSKNRFFNNRLQLNIEGFYWRYRNQQVAHAGVDLLNRAGNFTQNIGSSTIKGVEVETRFMATPTTMLSADVQYLNARNKSFTYQQAKFLGQPYTNCAVSTNANNAALFDVNCAGLPGYNAPKWTINMGIEQTIPLDAYKIVLSADTQFKTERYTYFDYDPFQLQGKSWTSNAQVMFGSKDNRWSIAGFVHNIENRRLLVAPVSFLSLLAGYTSAPRTYGLRLSGKY